MLVIYLIDDFETVFLGETGSDHALLELHEGLAFLLLDLLKSLDQAFFSRLELLCFLLILIDQSFLVIDLRLVLRFALLNLLLPVALHRVLAVVDHRLDPLSSICFRLLFGSVELFLPQGVLSELVSDGLHTLLLLHVHVVLRVIDLLSAHFLLLIGKL